MFSSIAPRYDWFDHVASLGNDALWRPRALWDLDRFRGHRPPSRIADIGCGTGDLALLAARRYPSSQIVGIDMTRAMLRRAALRRPFRALLSRVSWAEANALRLPFPSGRFDLVMSAFVVRNLPKLPEALAEFRRVLAPSGTLLTLEITEPSSPVIRRGFHAYFESFVPWLGAGIGRAGPYRYLPESLRHLPDRSGMLGLLRAAGFDPVAARPQSLGIVTTYLATAPE